MIVVAKKLINGRYAAGSVLEVKDSQGQRWIAMGIADPAPLNLGEYATGPAVVYRRPKTGRKAS